MATIAVPWFIPSADKVIEDFICKNGRKLSCAKGQILHEENQFLDKIIIQEQGILATSITYHDLNKSYLTCGLKFAGHISGYTTFVTREAAPVRLTAITDVKCYYVSFAEMDNYLFRNKELREQFYRYCAKCLRSEIDTMLAIITVPAEEKIWILIASIAIQLNIKLIEKWIRLPFKISRTLLSEMLYVSLLTIDRLYPRLIKNGFVRKGDYGYEYNSECVKNGLDWIRNRYNKD